jgi:hypothetical protein
LAAGHDVDVTLVAVQQPDHGDDRPGPGQRGRSQRLRSGRDAIANGIGMGRRHPELIPVLRATESIVLASEPHREPSMDLRSAEREVCQLTEQFGLPVDPWERVENISVAQQQRAEIRKVLYRASTRWTRDGGGRQIFADDADDADDLDPDDDPPLDPSEVVVTAERPPSRCSASLLSRRGPGGR